MELENFILTDDNIGIEMEGLYLDLHNNYHFRGMSYDVSSSILILLWELSSDSWVEEKLPAQIEMKFSEVVFFKIKERDEKIPYTDDDCLSVIAFIWNSMKEDMEAYTSNKSSLYCSHLFLHFMSGLAIKIHSVKAKVSLQ